MLRGTTAFLRDLPHDDCLEVVFVRSTEAHARILGIDTAEAIASPGVRAVLTAADLDLPAFRYYEPIPEAFARPLVATDRVRMVGEIVALVVADSSALATDASELVAVEYEPLPVVMTPADALAPGAPLLFEAAGTNVVLQYDRGRDEDLFDGAAHVERLHCPNNRLASAPLEPSAAIVRPTADGLDVWATSQGVHLAREEIARAIGLDEAHIRVRAASVGGGFGGRHSAVVEILVLAAAARSLRAPPPLGRDPPGEPPRHGARQGAAPRARGRLRRRRPPDRPARQERRRLRCPPSLRPADALRQPQARMRPVPRANRRVLVGGRRHQHDARRSLPGGRTARGHQRPRAHDGRRRPFPRHRSRRPAAPQPAHPRRAAPHDPDARDLRRR